MDGFIGCGLNCIGFFAWFGEWIGLDFLSVGMDWVDFLHGSGNGLDWIGFLAVKMVMDWGGLDKSSMVMDWMDF